MGLQSLQNVLFNISTIMYKSLALIHFKATLLAFDRDTDTIHIAFVNGASVTLSETYAVR